MTSACVPFFGAYVASTMGLVGYIRILDGNRGINLLVRFTTDRREVIDYVLVLVFGEGIAARTIRVYDSAHGYNEMHRFTSSGGKQTGKTFHSSTLGEGMRAAMREIEDGYDTIIEGWERQ